MNFLNGPFSCIDRRLFCRRTYMFFFSQLSLLFFKSQFFDMQTHWKGGWSQFVWGPGFFGVERAWDSGFFCLRFYINRKSPRTVLTLSENHGQEGTPARGQGHSAVGQCELPCSNERLRPHHSEAATLLLWAWPGGCQCVCMCVCKCVAI